jgi:lysophospholipase L1-like esterase
VPRDHDISRGLQFFRRNLASIDALVRARGARLVLLTMPVCTDPRVYQKVLADGHRGLSPPLPEDAAQFSSEFDAYNEAIREVGAQTGATVIDMNRLLGGDPRWFADVVHYNAAGSRRFGELLSAALAPVLRAAPREDEGR